MFIILPNQFFPDMIDKDRNTKIKKKTIIIKHEVNNMNTFMYYAPIKIY
jgi:hypothetical protein